MTDRVTVKPELYYWACERSGHDLDAFAARFPHLPAWASGDTLPTLKQLETFAKATHTPIGFFFLDQPPEERVPLPDFRTVAGRYAVRPSPDLLDTIYLCQQRQTWYRDYARTMGEPTLAFVGSARVTDDVVKAAAGIRAVLRFDLNARASMSTWEDALRHFIELAEDAGILVMRNGIVHNNTHRPLDPEEFRGFAIADDLAPVAFINGADTKAAQMFTLAHEIAHVWLGESALTDSQAVGVPKQHVERWCNQVAAELLVPLADIRRAFNRRADLHDEVKRLARQYKVSTLVVLRRIHDAGGITAERLREEYGRELARLRAVAKGEGGDFYRMQAGRVSRRFARAVVISTWEGRSSFTEAFRLLGVKRMDTFRALGQTVGVTA